ncbi:hypothetical protein BC830DRAFT_19579 [Chytriomyces sp. MP71]|nr:hypothetical protein BC830DRAFT_19579 [Chytriomyces sp. MP71]
MRAVFNTILHFTSCLLAGWRQIALLCYCQSWWFVSQLNSVNFRETLAVMDAPQLGKSVVLPQIEALNRARRSHVCDLLQNAWLSQPISARTREHHQATFPNSFRKKRGRPCACIDSLVAKSFSPIMN